MVASDFEALGGESALRPIIRDFVARVYRDPMIGFFFRAVSQQRIEELEYQHAAVFLGAPVAYQGRELRVAHQVHRIRSGHFNRRLQLLREELDRHRVPVAIIKRWVEHQEAQRGKVVAGDC